MPASSHKRRYPKQVHVFERNYTNDQNWKIAENFKTALGLSLVHAPGRHSIACSGCAPGRG